MRRRERTHLRAPIRRITPLLRRVDTLRPAAIQHRGPTRRQAGRRVAASTAEERRVAVTTVELAASMVAVAERMAVAVAIAK